MNRNSSQSDRELLRHQMDGIHESATELIQRFELRQSKVEQDEQPESVVSESEIELIEWLRASEENQMAYDRAREFDQSFATALNEVPEMEPGFLDRLKVLVRSDRLNAVDNDHAVDHEPDDYGRLFESTDSMEQALKGPKPTTDNESPVSPASHYPSGNGITRRWWLAATGLLSMTAAVILVAFLVQPDPQTPEAEYTAEMLCDDALTWNPNRDSQYEWNTEIDQAPVNRRFPGHLVRLKAQSWKKMELAGDKQGVVYNLVPQGNLSEPQAYLYVFQSDRDFQLPGQFASHATSNKKYRFWSVACRQELVFVLVYEGDEKRIQELIKLQQVG